jgi:hypothetical protein
MASAELPYASPISTTTCTPSATRRSRRTSVSRSGSATRSKSPSDRARGGPTSASLRRAQRTVTTDPRRSQSALRRST